MSASDVGTPAYGRLVRDGVVREALPGIALAADVVDSPAIRRALALQVVPSDVVVTGLAALWCEGLAPSPGVVHARCGPHRHVRNWRGPVGTVFHAAPAPSERVAPLPIAIADALRWEPLALALPVAYRIINEGRMTHADAVSAIHGGGGSRQAVSRAWHAWQAAADAAGVAYSGRRRAPVMRRAS